MSNKMKSRSKEFVIKLGNYEPKVYGKRQPGLDLSRVIGDFMDKQSLASSSDCCSYYPTIPVLEVATMATPTETEMENVPLLSLFRTTDGTDHVIFMKITASTTLTIAAT